LFGITKETESGHNIWNLNVWSLCGSGSLIAVSRELVKCVFHLVGIKEVGRDKGNTEPAEDCTFLCGNGNADHRLGTGFIGTRT
jgi:hypothetical protein